MKRLLGIFILSFCINSCDDGEFEIQSFDFSSIPAAKCEGANSSFFIYYTNEREALFLQIPESSFPEIITPVGNPRTVNITSTNKVTYRVYNGNVTSSTICSAIPPVTPIPVEEWNATSGVIEISTSANRETNQTTGQSFITGYTHTIKLVNALFIKGDGNQQLFNELFLGNFITPANPPSIAPSAPLNNCVTNLNYLFKFTADQVITLNTDANLFINEVTPENQPRTVLIGVQNTQMAYKTYEINVPSPLTFFCTFPNPDTAGTATEWDAVEGVAGQSGIIEVTTIEELDPVSQVNVFKHTVYMRSVQFEKDGTTFTFGDLYLLGFLFTSN
jgi:hypothetical protein